MAKASDVDIADANGAGPQAADRIASDPQAAADATGGKPLTSEPDASQPDLSQGWDPSAGSDAAEGAAVESRQVGPGRPPRATQWKKGGPSPNPRGRPRKDRTMLPDVKKVFEQALNKKVSVVRGDRQVLMTRLEIGFEQLLNQFAKGDRYARRDLMGYADKLGVDLLAKAGQAIEQALMPDHQVILDRFVARQISAAAVKPVDPAPAMQTPASVPPMPILAQRAPVAAPVPRVPAQGEPAAVPLQRIAAPQQRVIAPPELLDDDVAEDSAAKPDAVPSAAVEIKPEVALPTPIPGRQYPKSPERMTSMELRAWYPEWSAQYGETWQKQQLEKRRLQSLRPPPGRRPVQ